MPAAGIVGASGHGPEVVPARRSDACASEPRTATAEAKSKPEKTISESESDVCPLPRPEERNRERRLNFSRDKYSFNCPLRTKACVKASGQRDKAGRSRTAGIDIVRVGRNKKEEVGRKEEVGSMKSEV